MSQELVLKNVRLAVDDELLQIRVKDGRIAALETPSGSSGPVIDAGGRLLVPGFIDVHIQGAGGADVLDGTDASLQMLSQTLARVGTTGFLATSVFFGQGGNNHLRLAARSMDRNLGGAQCLGIHLEGPFINPAKKGGLNPAGIFPPSAEELARVIDGCEGALKMMTIAPELPGNLDLIDRLNQQNIIASFGHSDATYRQTLDGLKAGLSHVTHLFNVMPGLSHREPGPLLAIFEHDRVTAQIISDGVHVNPGMVRFARRLLGPDRCVCITDGVQAMGLPEGTYLYNGREYRSQDGTARYLDGTLIGSALPLSRIVDRFRQFTGCELAEAVNAGSLNPARVLGLDDRKGSVAIGKDADLVVLDDDFSVWMTIISGRAVWRKEKPLRN